jgi:hypothetical protein
MTEYSTGLFAQYNCNCVVQVLGEVNEAFEKMMVLSPGTQVDGQLRNLEKMMKHFERMLAETLAPRSMCRLLEDEVEGYWCDVTNDV